MSEIPLRETKIRFISNTSDPNTSWFDGVLRLSQGFALNFCSFTDHHNKLMPVMFSALSKCCSQEIYDDISDDGPSAKEGFYCSECDKRLADSIIGSIGVTKEELYANLPSLLIDANFNPLEAEITASAISQTIEELLETLNAYGGLTAAGWKTTLEAFNGKLFY